MSEPAAAELRPVPPPRLPGRPRQRQVSGTPSPLSLAEPPFSGRAPCAPVPGRAPCPLPSPLSLAPRCRAAPAAASGASCRPTGGFSQGISRGFSQGILSHSPRVGGGKMLRGCVPYFQFGRVCYFEKLKSDQQPSQ